MNIILKAWGLLLFLCCSYSAYAVVPPPDTALHLPVTSPPSCNQVTIAWTSATASPSSGYHGKRSLLVLQAVSATNAMPEPEQGITYISSSYFGAGQQLAPGQFVVYADSGQATTISGLQANTEYRADVFAYYDSTSLDAASGPVYSPLVTTATLYFTTPDCSSSTPPSLGASGASASIVDCSTAQLTCIPGNGDGRLFVIQRLPSGADRVSLSTEPQPGQFYFPNYLYGQGQAVAPDTYAMYLGPDSTATLYGLIPGERYKFVAYEYQTERDGTGGNMFTNPGYAAPVDTAYFTVPRCSTTEPLVAASSAAQSDTTTTTARVRWTNGNGVRRLVVINQIAFSNGLMLPQQNTLYQGATAFGQGSQTQPGTFVVYAGQDSSVTVSNLEPDTYYQLAVYEYNVDQRGLPTYLLSQAPAYTLVKTYPEPEPVAPSDLRVNYSVPFSYNQGLTQVSWKPGTGSHYVVFAQEVREGQQALYEPVDGILYNQKLNNDFSPAARVGDKTYILSRSTYSSSGADTIVYLRNLTIGHVYELAIFEYVLDGNGLPKYTGSLPMAFRAARMEPVLQGELINDVPTLTWTVGGHYHAEHFRIFASQDNTQFLPLGPGIPIAQDSSVSRVALTRQLSAITVPTYFKVEMYHRDGQWLYSNTILISPGKPLPVELLRLSGQVSEANRATLNWSTAQEKNSAYFSVERSLDGLHFVPVGRQLAAGTSTQQRAYRLVDPHPLEQLTYYRLHQVDQDGAAIYSESITLQPARQPLQLKVWPNPAHAGKQASLHLTGLDHQAGQVLVYIRTLTGQLLHHRQLQASPLVELRWSLAHYPPGVYLIEVQTSVGRHVARLVIE
ncbi:T9SS type A sorting domain-containing protein [Hymenobacter sp. J193]|uniref:T9SS type A sorting domain-containing protein n=1 Tax=Hymenobacter sp. J193 TaxID=2898429 RepID=UPI00215101A2|nr:T9SS type A sorting domain-containing protein [Hymenobacter sp. J193]MCR5890335.1 T9SS type A sorting domain-containing protein [Hymenobacter sp. J193]